MDVFNRKVTVGVEIDMDKLGSVTDEYLASCWHIAQANPAAHGDERAGELVEAVGTEIIRRFLKNVNPELYTHQRCHYFWKILTDNGKWDNSGIWQPSPIKTEESDV
jgi:hypothetical protein